MMYHGQGGSKGGRGMGGQKGVGSVSGVEVSVRSKKCCKEGT